MYGWIWRLLPGPWPVKLILLIALLVGVFFLLMNLVFPMISPLLPYNDVSV
ncbi:hypothetical protein [Corynebacterium sp. 11A]|uniref:hypothetical protein n=1 Tax=Corynebacterium sp. 11A TaxID=2080510 RepID=UPI00178C5640|nr:hypothetical protein [Corynebacterium sp. 11A]